MIHQQGVNQAPVQYVMMGNQMVAVQAILPQGQPMGTAMYPTYIPDQSAQQFQPIQGIPVGYAPPQQIVYPQQPPTMAVGMTNPNLNQQTIDDYRKNVRCYVLTYLLFFIACIVLQYVLYGSITAARLWIARYAFIVFSYVFLFVTFVFFFVQQEKIQIWHVRGQMLFLSVSLVLEIAAFAVAVSHPVLFDYFRDTSYYTYNSRRILYYYSYSDCYNYYYYLSKSEYERYYAADCDPVLGRNSYDETYYDDSDYYNYYGYYGVYAGDYPNNMCSGYYDPYRSYCFPLQIGILVYEIMNLIFYMMVYVALIRRIRHLFIIFKTSSIIGINNPQIVMAQGQQSQIISQQPIQQ